MEDLTWEQSLRGLSVTEAVPQKLATLRNARNKLEAAAEETSPSGALPFRKQAVKLARIEYDVLDASVREIDHEIGLLEGSLQANEHKLEPANRLKGSTRARKGRNKAPATPEPMYCFCGREAFGDMIACENPDCPIEWFHFGCVGLASSPKGEWYCPRCTAARAAEAAGEPKP